MQTSTTYSYVPSTPANSIYDRSNTIRIGHFLPQYGTNTGTGGAIKELLEGCRSQPHMKHIVYLAGDYQNTSENVEIVRFDRATATGWSSVMRRIQTNSDQLDFLSIHHPFSPINLLISAACRVPLLYFPHGCFAPATLSAPRKKLKKLLYGALFEKRIIQKSKCVVCSTDTEERDLRNYVQCRTAVIPFPWSRGAISIPRDGTTIDLDQFRLLYIGRIDVHNKGLDTLVAAISKARRSGANITLRIAGYGDATNMRILQDLILKCDNKGAIEFIGPIYGTKKTDEIEAADLYCQLSRFESFGMSIVEALSYGKPVLLARGVALAQALEKAGCARVVSTNDVASTAEAIEELCKNHNMRNRMGVRASKWVYNELDPLVIAAKAAKLIETLSDH